MVDRTINVYPAFDFDPDIPMDNNTISNNYYPINTAIAMRDN